MYKQSVLGILGIENHTKISDIICYDFNNLLWVESGKANASAKIAYTKKQAVINGEANVSAIDCSHEKAGCKKITCTATLCSLSSASGAHGNLLTESVAVSEN